MSTTVRALNPIEAALEDASYASTLDMQQKHLAIAQIEATRAQTAALEQLVYEQRTANLIALFDEEGPEVFRAEHTGLPGTAGRLAVEASIRLMYLEVADKVASRVGIR